MTIATIDGDQETLLVVQDRFDASDADALHDLLLHMERDRVVTVDFRAIRRMEDFVIARLASDLARDPVHVLGLTDHQRRILRYVSPGDGRRSG